MYMIVQQYSSFQRAVDLLLKPGCVGLSAFFLACIDSKTESVSLFGRELTKGQFYALQAFVASLLTTPISTYVFDNHMRKHPRFKEIGKDMVNIGVHVALTASIALQYNNKGMAIPLMIAALSEVIGEYANQAVLPMI